MVGQYIVGESEMERMLNVDDVARMLHVHPNTVRRWSDDGRIRVYRISARGDRRYMERDIARFLAEVDSHRGNKTRTPVSGTR